MKRLQSITTSRSSKYSAFLHLCSLASQYIHQPTNSWNIKSKKQNNCADGVLKALITIEHYGMKYN